MAASASAREYFEGELEEEVEEVLDLGDRQELARQQRAAEEQKKAEEEAERLLRERKAPAKEQERLLLEQRNNPSWSICDGGCGGCWKYVEEHGKCRQCGCGRLAHVRNMDDCEVDEDDEDYESIYGGGETW